MPGFQMSESSSTARIFTLPAPAYVEKCLKEKRLGCGRFDLGEGSPGRWKRGRASVELGTRKADYSTVWRRPKRQGKCLS